jgi:hypothetical protein
MSRNLFKRRTVERRIARALKLWIKTYRPTCQTSNVGQISAR